MLAQISAVAPDHLRDIAIILFALLGGLGSIAAIIFGILHAVRKNRPSVSEITPQPLAVRKVHDYVDMDTWSREHNAVLARIAKVEQHYENLQSAIADQGQGIDAKLTENAKEFRASLGIVHRRLDGVLPVLYKMAGKLGVIVSDQQGGDT